MFNVTKHKKPRSPLKKSLIVFAVGASLLTNTAIVSTLYFHNFLPVVNADDSGNGFCVTAEVIDEPEVKITRGDCELTDIPDGGGTVTYNNETIIGWASQSLSHMSQEESDFEVQNGMLSTYSDFVNEKDFPTNYANAAKSRGASLLVAWEPYDWENKTPEGDLKLDQPEFKPSNITAGAYDNHITAWLTEAQKHTKDTAILVRFAPEMNDAVRPWSIGVNGGNTKQEYIDMWKHVYNIKEAIAPDVKLMWNPLVAGSDPLGNAVSLASVYPGSEYVDVLALDGFNWADVQNPGTCGWQSYDDIFGSGTAAVAEIKALAGSKPWGIAEVASVSKDDSFFQPGGPCESAWGWVYQWPVSGDFYKTPEDWITQAGWMKTMVQSAHKDGALFVNMFNTNKETDWRLNSSELGKPVLKNLTVDSGFKAGSGSSALIKDALK